MRKTIVAFAAVLAFAASTAPASAAPASRSASVSAGYMLHVATNGQPYHRELMTLLENHTGYTDLDAITWSRHDRRITLVFRNRQSGQYEATYSGTLRPTGISTRRHPGTIRATDGAVGIFYAVNKTR